MNRPTLLSLIALVSAITFFPHRAAAQPTAWESRGPGGGGALFLPSISPHNAQELFIACDMTELFHSTNLGTSWSQVSFHQIAVNGSLGHVEFTSDPAILYAIDNTTESPFPVKSTDGGGTWHALPADPTDGGTFACVADPSSTTRVLVADYSNLFISTDGGATFASRYSTAGGNGLLIAGAFFDGANIYVGTNLGLLVSANGGTSFTLASLGGIPSDQSIVSMAGAKSGNTIRLACVTLGDGDVYPGVTGADHGSYKGVYTLDVGGAAWTSRGGTITAGVEPFFAGMARNNTGVVYVAGGSESGEPTVMKSTDGGASWQRVLQTNSNANVATGWSGYQGDRGWSYGEYALGFAVAPTDPNIVAITDLGFAHVTSDGGTTWHQAYVAHADENAAGAATPTGRAYHSVGLENTTSWQVAWADSATMFACYSDIKGVISKDAGATWGFGYSGHSLNSMYRIAIDRTNNRMYAGTSSVHDMYQSTTLTDTRIDAGSGQVLFSTNKGSSWQVEHDFKHPVIWVAIDPNNSEKVYASVINSSSGGIYATSNASAGAGSQWAKLTNPPRTEGHPFNVHVLKDGSLVATFSGRRTSNFTASSGVFISTNGGTSWVDRSSPKMLYWTKDVVIDPHDPTENTWYVGVFSGYGGAANGLGGLYRTTDRGVTWKMILDQDRVTSCTVSPDNANEMYATTEVGGLWYSSNAASATPTFTNVASYPFRQPERVFYNPYKLGEIWVSSFGNGMRCSASAVQTPPGITALTSPANDSTGVPLSRSLVWSATGGATTYRVQLATTDDFAAPTLDADNLSTTSQPFNGLTPATVYYWRARAANATGPGPWSSTWHFTTRAASGVAGNGGTASGRGISLSNNIMREGSEETLVTFELPHGGHAVVTIVDVRGREVARLFDENAEAGIHAMRWNAAGLASGIYYCRVAGPDLRQSAPVMVIR